VARCHAIRLIARPDAGGPTSSRLGAPGTRQEVVGFFLGFRGVVELDFAVDRVVERLMPPAFVVPARTLVGFDSAAFDGARFAVVPDGFVVFATAGFAAVVLAAALVDFEDLLVDRRAFFGELPIGSALLTALPALVAASPTTLPALIAASPTALPALDAAPPTALPAPDEATDSAALPTALPAPDEATDSAALPTAPAALPTVFPTFLPTLFTSLVRSAIFVLLIHPSAGAVDPQYGCASAVSERL
jgi:hypothetical protein